LPLRRSEAVGFGRGKFLFPFPSMLGLELADFGRDCL